MDPIFPDLRSIETPGLESPSTRPGQGPESVPGRDFGALVGRLVAEVNEKQNAAEANAAGLAKGETGIMETVVSLNEADLSLRMMMQLRDRALDAYQRILRSL